MRVIALDLGSKRIGVAVSDDAGTVATPLTTLERDRDKSRLHRDVARLVSEWDAGLVLLGLPIDLDGDLGPAAQAVLVERDELAAVLSVPVEVHDERLTTRIADRALRERGDLDGRARRAVVDMVAASVILQDWLDRHREDGAGGSVPDRPETGRP
jgi:putative Holliday junction resolvase